MQTKESTSKNQSQVFSNLPWWEREKLLTEKDKQAIQKAIQSYYADIDENWAETEIGRAELRKIARRKFHDEEWMAGMG